MITGAIILLVGIVIGYFLRYLVIKPNVSKFVNRALNSQNAKIIELNEEIDLGEDNSKK